MQLNNLVNFYTKDTILSSTFPTLEYLLPKMIKSVALTKAAGPATSVNQ